MIRTVELYNSTVFIEFDADKHFYRVVGSNSKPDGVTTILGLVPKFLLGWAGRVGPEMIAANVVKRLEAGDPLELSYILALCEEAKDEWKRKRDTAGDIGTLVHAFAEEVIGGVEVDDEFWQATPEEAHPGCLAFLQWWETVQIDRSQMESERIVYSSRLFYCGTCDLFAYIDGRPTVVDFKTGSGFYEDQPLQLAAYAMALEEELGIEIKDGWIIHLDKETGKCTPYHVEIDRELKADWEQVRIAWRAVKRNQERHKQIKRNQKCQTSQNTIQAAAP